MGKGEGSSKTPKSGGRRLKREETYDQLMMCQEFYELLRNAKDATGKLLAEPFMRVPSRRTDGGYYEIVKEPIDFTRINQRLRADEYSSFNDFCTDVELVISNAQLFYQQDSPEHAMAVDLHKFYVDSKARLLNPSTPSESVEPSPSPVPSLIDRPIAAPAAPPDETKLEAILASLLSFTDKQNRLLSPPFRVLAPPEELPGYYEIVTNPIDLKVIATKIRNGDYSSWGLFDEDMRLLVSNCKAYNGAGNQLSRDAVRLFQHFEQKRTEIANGKLSLDKAKIAENHSAVDGLIEQKQIAPESDLIDDSEEDEETENDPNPLWVLYWAVRNAEGEGDSMLADYFLELPNSNLYPDYYDEIREPMSLYAINHRIKTGLYSGLQDLVNDLLLVCYNARCYNIEGSTIHSSACKLEEFIAQKAVEIDPTVTVNIVEVPNDDDDEEEEKPVVAAKASKKRPRLSITESDDTASETSYIRPPSKRRKSEYMEFGSGTSSHRKHPQGRKSIEEHRIIFKNKLLKVWNTVMNFDQQGRRLANPLVMVPDAKAFPEYYTQIAVPMDMTMIKNKIEQFYYPTSQEFINDFTTLFNNVRQLYPPDSELYHDANALQNVCMNQLGQISKDQLLVLPVRKDRGRNSSNSSPVKAKAPDTPVRTPLPRPKATPKMAPPATPSAESRSNSVSKANLRVKDVALMKTVYNAILNFTGSDGRTLSDVFVRLPTKEEYPNYYEKIKRPMDLQRVQQKMNNHSYDSLKAMISDLKLIFDNACLFNDPASKIYKDALVLQKEVLQLRNQYVQDEFTVQAEVKLLLTNLLVSVTTYTSGDGRCLSECFEELPKWLKKAGVPEEEYPFSLDEIKYNLDRGRYRRLDRFQDDLFYLFAKFREYAPLDSEVFYDTVELQRHFIHKREELCRSVLVSPAKLYIMGMLDNEVETVVRVRRQKEKEEKSGSESARESQARDSEQMNNSGDTANAESMPSVEYEGLAYFPKEYVYVASAEDDAPPDAPKHIMRIERIFHDEEGTAVVRGIWCYKPRETFHLATRLFYPNEVFLTPFKDTVTVDRLRGKCLVMFADEYLKKRPTEFPESDVFVCESRYLGRKQHFKKLTAWPYPDELDLLATAPRSELLKVTKVKSELAQEGSEAGDVVEEKKSKSRSGSEVPKARSNSPADLISERVRNLPRVLDIHREEVKDSRHPPESGKTYYEQMLYQGVWYRQGDGVLAFKEQAGHCDVYRINKMWRTNDGEAFISGPWFARPSEIKHDLTATFYKREVIGVEQADAVINMNRVQARCAILSTKAYETCRPTEFPECDVFVVERRVIGYATVDEIRSSCSLLNKSTTTTTTDGTDFPLDLTFVRRLVKLREYKQSLDVPEDETYYFKVPLEMEKEPSPLIAGSDTSLSVDPADIENESSNIADVSIAGQSTSETPSAKWLESQPKLNAKSKSGYILFSAEIRKRIMSENPEAGFGEVSRIVGVEWKKLTDEQKRQYEVRAQYIADERAKNDLLTPNSKVLQPGQVRVFFCRWQSCDYQFDCQEGLYEHVKTSHTSQIVDGENQFVCLWQSCLKYRKEGKPFPSLPRLHRHIKEKHLPSAAKPMQPHQRSKHYFVYIAPNENAAANSNREAPPGHFVNHQFGQATPNAPACTLATPLEEMQTTVTTTPARSYVAAPADPSTPHRTVKVVNAVYQAAPGSGQYVQQQAINGSMPVQYYTVGQPLTTYQVVVNGNQPPGPQPVQVYHFAPNENAPNRDGQPGHFVNHSVGGQGTPKPQPCIVTAPYDDGQQTPGRPHMAVDASRTVKVVNAGYQAPPYPGTFPPPQQVPNGSMPVQYFNQHYTSAPATYSHMPPVTMGPTPSVSTNHLPPPPAPSSQPAPPEPQFVTVPDSFNIRRVLHTKAYANYLENLHVAKQRCVSQWRKTLGINGRPEPITKDKLTWVKPAVKRKLTDEELAQSIYLLRDQLLETTCGIKRRPTLS